MDISPSKEPAYANLEDISLASLNNRVDENGFESFETVRENSNQLSQMANPSNVNNNTDFSLNDPNNEMELLLKLTDGSLDGHSYGISTPTSSVMGDNENMELDESLLQASIAETLPYLGNDLAEQNPEPSTSMQKFKKPKKPKASKDKDISKLMPSEHEPRKKTDNEPEYNATGNKNWSLIKAEGFDGYKWKRVQEFPHLKLDYYECKRCSDLLELTEHKNKRIGSLLFDHVIKKLKGYPENPGGYPHICEKPRVKPTKKTEPEYYFVEQIIDVQRSKDGINLEYFVKWLNYGPEEDSWEPEASLNCPDKLKEFKSSVEGKQKLAMLGSTQATLEPLDKIEEKPMKKRGRKKKSEEQNKPENEEYFFLHFNLFSTKFLHSRRIVFGPPAHNSAMYASKKAHLEKTFEAKFSGRSNFHRTVRSRGSKTTAPNFLVRSLKYIKCPELREVFDKDDTIRKFLQTFIVQPNLPLKQEKSVKREKSGRKPRNVTFKPIWLQPTKMKHPNFDFVFEKFQETAKFFCVACDEKIKLAKFVGGKAKRIGPLNFNRATRYIHGDPESPGNLPHICTEEAQKRMASPAPVASQIKPGAPIALNQNLHIDTNQTPSSSSSGYSSNSSPNFSPSIKNMKWAPEFLPRDKMKHPVSKYIFVRSNQTCNGYEAYNCTECLKVYREMRKQGKTFGTLPAIIYVPKQKLAYGDPEKPYNKEHLCENPEAWNEKKRITSTVVRQNTSIESNLLLCKEEEFKKLIMEMNNEEFIKIHPPTKAQLHDFYQQEIVPQNFSKDGFSSYVKLDSKFFPGISYVFYQRKAVFDLKRNMKILYYVCYDCWVMQSMEHFEDIPKICMDENYSMLDIGGTVDQPRNTKRHYCVDTDELVASRLRWEAEKRRLLENVPFAELPKQIKMNGIPGHLEPLSAWLSREVPNPPPREKVPMGPGKCGKRCHYCSGDKRAYSFVNCTNNSNSPTSQNGISTINVTALAIEQEVEAQQHKIETPQSAEILRTKNPSPDAEMADLTKTLQDRVIVTSPSNATPQQESPNESASDELEPMQVDSPLEDIFEQATISTAISSSNQVAPLELPQTMTRSSPDSAITITDSSDLSEESQDGMKLISASYTALELCTKAEEKKTPVLSSNGAQLAETSNGAVGATSQTQASTSDVTPTLENVTPMSHATFSAVLTPTPTSSSKPNKLNLAANFAEFKERHKKKLDELKKIQEPSTETSTLQASSNEECKPIEENGPKVTENRNESAQEKVEVSKQRSEVKQASVSSRVLKATAKDSAKNPSINLPTALLNSTSTPTSSSSSILENIIPVEERQDQHTDLLTRDHEMDEHYHEQEDYELEGCFSPPASPIQSSSQCSSLENAATPKVSYSLKQLANVITKEQIVSQKKRLESFSQKKNQEEALENQHESMFASSSKFANPNEALEFKLKQKEVLSEEFYVAEIRNSEEIEVVDLEQEENSRQNNEESQNNTAGISMNIDGVPGVQEIVRASISSKQNATKATTPSNDIVAQEKSAVARAKPTLRQMAKKTIQQPRNTTVKPSKKPANSTPTYSMTLPLNTLEVVNVENPPVGASQPVNPTATTNNTSSSPNKRTKSDSDDDEIVFLKEVVSSKKPKVLYTSYGSSDEIQIIEPESTPNRPLTRFNTRTPRSRSITSQDLTPRNSRCLVITNLYKPASTKDIDFNDLADDFIANCEDYGGIQHLYIDHDFLGGKAFIKCPDVASAKLTAECFDQKVFIDQKMSVKFVPEEEYYLLYPKAKNATKLLVASSI